MTAHILIVSSGLHHPSLLGRWRLNRLLASQEGIHAHYAPSLEALTSLAANRFQALVLNFHQKMLSAPALAAFTDYLVQGGGVLALHGVTASFKETLAFFDLLGGRFTGHGPVEQFSLSPAAEMHPLFAGIEPFSVTDELYQHELRGAIQVQFTAPLNGVPLPVVWTHAVGRGRVCYACPGHRAETLRQPTYQEVLRRGLKFALGGAA